MSETFHNNSSEHLIPEDELKTFEEFIRTHTKYLDADYIRQLLEKHEVRLSLDPFAEDLLQPVKIALSTKNPFSVVRIGDGEANILAFGVYQGTPNLDRYVFSASIENQQDTFQVSETWMPVLREQMWHAVLNADMVGILGLWRPNRWRSNVSELETKLLEKFRKDKRGIVGHVRGIDIIVDGVTKGLFDSQVFAPAHLYFSAICHLEELIALSDRVICITDKVSVVHALKRRFANHQFELITVGKSNHLRRSALLEPDFLYDIENRLPADMSGCLCLIGAGVWAEFYCTFVKQRGGVAIDIGSGFDLLAGVASRPVHKSIPASLLQRLNLTKT